MNNSANCVMKNIYILSDNCFLLPGVKHLLSTLDQQDVTFSVNHIANNNLHCFFEALKEQEDDANTVNYFIAEKQVFYILKSNNKSPAGIIIPPTVNLDELCKILLKCNEKETLLNSDFYYRNTHSHREVEVVSMLLEGIQPKNIANKLGISIKTVSHHKQIAIKKSGFSNFNEYYLRNLTINPFIPHH
ncbi:MULTISPECIES: response regulator transcription factor [Buttiauxella]|uniref:HTH luxR-type domain-containing protein n=1 Tax=Buttiauxella ferragutiae ATCC 51602 TaxID=1354252 RepID=A0ABX2W297_9ENTR|nr:MULTISPECIES: LuxR C-terminal-related transcriptional regulator [Buttiauxella]AYN27212.1 LuxR family transcriptional regulator [Buttiauxella sp. 3AFRM03]MCE0825062.1 LuxR C-terminal-related transcriptional regulator [Buttiauxella ferragutiae]OAT24614.1 hypothetical protein M976_04383 [Buttiauxella ferragutiae ATCC 51602]UNK60312.1 LuxR C-terminal-related transcriptional regulator [Buttiauxella ferragutiae]